MKRYLVFSFALLWFGGNGGSSLVLGLQGVSKPALKGMRVVAFLPFEISEANQLALKNQPLLEDQLTLWIMHGDSARSFVFPGGIRLQLKNSKLADDQILRIPPDSLGKLFSAEAVLFTRIVRLYESEGSNQTTRQIRASKYVRRGVELLVEFRLVEAASGKALWKHKIQRFAADVPEVIMQAGQAAAEAWPLKR